MALSTEYQRLLDSCTCPALKKVKIGTLIANLMAGIFPTGSVSAAELAANAVETAKIKDGNVTAAKLGASAVETAKINDGAVTYAKVQNVSASDRLLGRATAEAGVVEEITVGGDITQSGSTFTIGADKVTTEKIINGAVTADKLAADSVNKLKIAGSSVSLPKLDCASGELVIDAANGVGTVPLEGYGATFRVMATCLSAPATGIMLNITKADALVTFTVTDGTGTPVACDVTNAVVDYIIFDV